MSEKVDAFCNNLRDHLNAVEERMNRVKANIQASSDESREALEAKRKKIEAHYEADKHKVEEAKAKAANWVEGKKTETDAKIEEWKINRETHKIEKRADRAEDYATSAIYIAAVAVDEADLSILEAIAARMIADEAAAQG
jgi:uncharacterized protein (DUF342 family)